MHIKINLFTLPFKIINAGNNVRIQKKKRKAFPLLNDTIVVLKYKNNKKNQTLVIDVKVKLLLILSPR